MCCHPKERRRGCPWEVVVKPAPWRPLRFSRDLRSATAQNKRPLARAAFCLACTAQRISRSNYNVRMSLLPTGKLPADQLARLLAEIAPADRRVLVGPGVGIDCAVIDLGAGRCLVAKSDPITFATDEIGWYAVHVNANDIATTGASPRWFLATILLPEGKADVPLA